MDSMRHHQFEVEYDGSAVERPADVAAFWRAKVAGIDSSHELQGWRSRHRQHRQSGRRCAALG
jgi:hypothetical protein